MATTAQVADAVLAVINGNGAWVPGEFTATRKYLPEEKREKFEDLQVTVVPVGHDEELFDRGSTAVGHIVHIGVQKNVDPSDNTAVDALHTLVFDICAYMRKRSISLAKVAWAKSTVPANPLPEDLVERRFTAVIQLEYIDTSTA